MRQKRFVSMLCFAIILLYVLSGCTSSTQTSEPEGSSPAAETKVETPTTEAAEPDTTERDTSPVTLTVFINSPGEFKGMDTSEVGREITKRTGVTLDIKFATTRDSQELNTMIATGNLPDVLVYGLNDAVRTILWKQGYLAPLNQLMDEFAPSMWDIMPADMDKFYTEDDGNMYLIPKYYADLTKLSDIRGNLTTEGAFVMHTPTYEALGSPPIDSLEDYKHLLLEVQEKYPGKYDFIVYDGRIIDPLSHSNMAELINRMYGGTNQKAVAEDGTVHLNFKDETYKKAILFMNELYREGLFNPENFTADDRFEEFSKNQKIFSFWGQSMQALRPHMEDESTRTYHTYDPPREPGITPKIMNLQGSIGISNGTSISANSKNKERAIQYFEFLLSEEGQMLLYHGIEGVHYTMVDGMPKNTEIKDNKWNTDFAGMQNEMGIMNSALNWFPLLETDSKLYYWLNVSKPAYNEIGLYEKYSTNERWSSLATIPSDSEEKVIETKIFDLWKSSMPKMILADTEEKSIAAYDAFVKEAEDMGLAQLEAAYTRVVKDTMEKLK